jgi:hypothetical protein
MEPFDPADFFVVTSTRLRLVPREPDDYVVPYESNIRGYAAPEDDEPTVQVGSARWLAMRLSAVADDEEDPLDVADAHSADLLAVYEALNLGGEGESAFELWGDLIYVESINVEPGHDVRRMAAELIDHILRFHGAGSAGAAFVFGKSDPPEVRDAFVDRGFERLTKRRDVAFELYVHDSARKRPPLPPIEGSHKVRRLRPGN